jgi:hypothetical protein
MLRACLVLPIRIGLKARQLLPSRQKGPQKEEGIAD